MTMATRCASGTTCPCLTMLPRGRDYRSATPPRGKGRQPQISFGHLLALSALCPESASLIAIRPAVWESCKSERRPCASHHRGDLRGGILQHRKTSLLKAMNDEAEGSHDIMVVMTLTCANGAMLFFPHCMLSAVECI